MGSTIVEKITSAIGAHGMWKQRINAAIDTGKSEFAPDTVKADCNCEFGKWLQGCGAVEKASGHFDEVRKLHMQFHQVAGEVLQLALAGNKQKAKTEVDVGGSFAAASAALTKEMMAWKRAAGQG